jgi:hypothetical protein
MLVSGYWILKGNYPYFIQHPASSIQDQFGLLIQAERFYSVSCQFETELRSNITSERSRRPFLILRH